MSDQSNLQQLFDAALAHHQAGRLAQAEPVYRQVLAVNPNQPEALHLLGLLYHQAGHSQQGLDLILRSVQLAPTFSSLNNLGEVLRALARHNEAIACYRRAIELNPKFAEAYANLGWALFDLAQLNDAEKALARATQLAPQRPEFHLRLNLVRQKQGDPHGAVLAGRRAVELAPQQAEAWSSLAVSLASVKKDAQALEAANRAIGLAPNRAEAWVNLGFVHERASRHADAESAYLKAIELNPSYSVAHRNLAAMYDSQNRIEQSIPPLVRALELQPRDIEGWNNLSTLRRRAMDIRGAVQAAETALALNRAHPSSHGNLGLALLTLGDYKRGFAEYEWRWRCDSFTTTPRDFGRPMWDGSDPAGRTIFVHTEQGFGDTIQFVRYVPMLAARGARIILECTLPLRNLLPSVKGVSKVVVAGVRPPDFDLHIPLLSLPKIFQTTLETVPNQVPYLSVDDERLAQFKQKTGDPDARLRVGLTWAGNVKPDPARTCPLELLAPLASIPGTSFFSLQKGDNARDIEGAPAGMKITNLSDDLKDFADTAAAMLNLDLIITIDTAAAHLAGALGCPTWTMLPRACDWRWLIGREDSPWYPTMRLFRQPTRGDWQSVISRMADVLRQRVSAANC
jgi:tetratricopeptide (TPR) repeat protein